MSIYTCRECHDAAFQRLAQDVDAFVAWLDVTRQHAAEAIRATGPASQARLATLDVVVAAIKRFHLDLR